MIFSAPIPFGEALAHLRRRQIAPTNLGSAQIERINQDVLRASFFSARTAEGWLLEAYKQRLERLLNPQQVRRADRVTADNPEGWVTEGLSEAEFRTQIKELMRAMDYQPPTGKEGTIQDLSSDQRIELVIRTNAEMAQNYGFWVQGQNPVLLDAFPAQELVRIEDRTEKRSWIQRWRANGGKVYPGTSPGLPIEPGFSEGRLIARKDDPIWRAINRFGNPYPPFDFNSGLGVEDVGHDEAVRLGVIQPGETVQPVDVRFGESLGQMTEVTE